MRRSLACTLLALVACHTRTGSEAAAPPGAGNRPGLDPAELAPNCQAPLALSVEVSRLLVTAAAHATRSSACVDGPGARVAIGDLLVCPGRRRDREIAVVASYRVARHAEGGAQSCDGDCREPGPQVTRHRAELRFRRAADEGPFRIDAPTVLPGLELLTPLDREHDGDCYGRIGPFVASELRVD